MLIIHIPVFGWLVGILVKLTGFGAALATRFGTGRPWFPRAQA